MTAPVGLYGRQLDVFNPDNPEHQRDIIIVGAGTIGSWLTLALAKLGCQNITVIDDDSVELHNIPNQFYIQSQIDTTKVSALTSLIKAMKLPDIFTVGLKFNNGFPLRPNTILVSCVDNMATRKQLFEYAKANPFIRFFVDGRMAGQVIRVFSIDMSKPEDVAFYEATLYSDDTSDIKNEEARAASEVPCTARSVVDVSFMIAGKMAGSVRKFITGGKVSRDFIFDAKNDILMTE